jgi:hypothetical protein
MVSILRDLGELILESLMRILVVFVSSILGTLALVLFTVAFFGGIFIVFYLISWLVFGINLMFGL